MTKYLDPLKDSHKLCFQDYIKKENNNPNLVECPRCFGYGGWNLALNQYPLHGKSDTPENRHLYCHFRACCSQCNGWGYVVKDSKDATCIHEWKEISRPINNRSGIHICICTKCNSKTSYDTSD